MIERIRAYDRATRRIYDVMGFNMATGEVGLRGIEGVRPMEDVDILYPTGIHDDSGHMLYTGDMVKVIVEDFEPVIRRRQIVTGVLEYIEGVYDVRLANGAWSGITAELHLGACNASFRRIGNIHTDGGMIWGEEL